MVNRLDFQSKPIGSKPERKIRTFAVFKHERSPVILSHVEVDVASTMANGPLSLTIDGYLLLSYLHQGR